MIINILATVGALFLLWTAVQRAAPDLAEWRSAELLAWAKATRQTQRRLVMVWRLHWKTYREELP